MASTIFFVNQKGDEVVSRHYRNDVAKSAMDAFRYVSKIYQLGSVLTMMHCVGHSGIE